MCYKPNKIKVYKKNGEAVWLTVNCGKCIECAKAQSNEWALRIMLEAKHHSENCCITLTYNDEHLPTNGELDQRAMQLFLKSLRKELAKEDIKIRYFYSAEYGSRRGRPHYHIIIFGWTPKDLKYHHTDRGNEFYTSKFIEQFWTNGFNLVGKLTYKTAFYCAKYLQKFAGTDKAVRPFVRMSLKPGLGICSIDDVKDGYIYYDGRRVPIPRYFLRYMNSHGLLDFWSYNELVNKRNESWKYSILSKPLDYEQKGIKKEKEFCENP